MATCTHIRHRPRLGIPKVFPCCNWRKRKPASSLVTAEKGGVLISPSSQTRGLSTELTKSSYVAFDIASTTGAYSDPNRHPFRWQSDTRSEIRYRFADIGIRYRVGPAQSLDFTTEGRITGFLKTLRGNFLMLQSDL